MLMIFILFLFIDIILIYRPIPILAFPIMSFFIYTGVTTFYKLPSTSLPMNPELSIFFMFFCVLGLLVNALDFSKTKKVKINV